MRDNMTAQIRERLVYNEVEVPMCSCPLNIFLRLADFPKSFKSPHTALWRGYVGTWDIIDNRLYLISIKGEFTDGTTLSLDSIFPGFKDRVFAHWYTGNLRIPYGAKLKYVHMGFGSIHEFDLFIKIKKGVVLNTFSTSNKN